MTLANRIGRLEASLKRVEQSTRRGHLIVVDDCRLDDEAHNEAQKRRALAANPPPEGAIVAVIQIVAPKNQGSSDEP